jgi:hypothetical protein
MVLVGLSHVLLDYQTRFRPDRCAAGITLSDDNTVATKTCEYWGLDATNVVLTRPASDDQGDFTVTWRRTTVTSPFYGWAVPDLGPNTRDAYLSHGSFIGGDGCLYGLGTVGDYSNDSFWISGIPKGGTLSLRYNPARGAIYARVNGGAEALCFTDLRNDLVPAVLLFHNGCSCTIVDDHE